MPRCAGRRSFSTDAGRSTPTLGYRDAGNNHLFGEFDAPIEDGILELFLSYLRHSCPRYKGQSVRTVIAFNSRDFLKGVPSKVRP
jgi:hypothetical protein